MTLVKGDARKLRDWLVAACKEECTEALQTGWGNRRLELQCDAVPHPDNVLRIFANDDGTFGAALNMADTKKNPATDYDYLTTVVANYSNDTMRRLRDWLIEHVQ